MRADDGRARKRQFSNEIFNGAEGEGGAGFALRAARSPSARHSEAIASSRAFKADTECAQAVGCADHRDRRVWLRFKMKLSPSHASACGLGLTRWRTT